MIVDDKGFVTVRATVVPFRPKQGHPLAYDCAEGQGRFVVDHRDVRKLKPYDCVTVRFYPDDQFARLVEGGGTLPWERKRCCACDGEITTIMLAPDVDERCVHCADYDEDDPDFAELGIERTA